VDVDDHAVGILELPSDRLTRVEATATSPPEWLPDSSGVLVTHHPRRVGQPFVAPDGRVHPLDPDPADMDAIGRMSRSGVSLVPTDFGAASGARLAGIDRNGRVAYLAGGRLYIGDGPDDEGELVSATADETVLEAAFASGEDAMVIVVAGRLELLDLETGERTVLAPDGNRPGWLP